MDFTSLAFFFAAFTSLFTIINPFSTTSVFISITRGDSPRKKLRMIKNATFTAALVLISFALLGNYILGFFSITLEAFRIAGGILVVGVGMNMVHKKKEFFHSEKEKKHAQNKEDISIIPLAIPMMSGPGAMAAAIVLMGETASLFDVVSLILAIISVCILTFVILKNANIIERAIGETGRRVMDKILGLIVLVVGVQFIINGVLGVLP